MRRVWFTLLTVLALAMSACGSEAPATAGDGYTPANQADADHADVTSDASVTTVLTVAPLDWQPATLVAGQTNARLYGTEFFVTRTLDAELPEFRIELIAGRLHDESNRPAFTNARLENTDTHVVLAGPVNVRVNTTTGQLEPIHFPNPLHMMPGRSLRTAIVVDVRNDLTSEETGSQFRIVSNSGTDRFFLANRVTTDGNPVPHEAIAGDSQLSGGIITLANPVVRVLLGDQVTSHTTVRSSAGNNTLDIEVHNDYAVRVNFRQSRIYGIRDTGHGFTRMRVSDSVIACALSHGGTPLSGQQTPNAESSLNYTGFSFPIEPGGVEHFVLICQASSLVENRTAGDRIAFGLQNSSDAWFTDSDGHTVRTTISMELERQLTTPSTVLTIAQHGNAEVAYGSTANFGVIGGSGAIETVINGELRSSMEEGTMETLAVRITGHGQCVDSLRVVSGDMPLSHWTYVFASGPGTVLINNARQLLVRTTVWTNMGVQARFRATGTGSGDCHRGDLVAFEISRGSIPGSGIFDAYNTASDIYIFGNVSGDTLIPSGIVQPGAIVTVN